MQSRGWLGVVVAAFLSTAISTGNAWANNAGIVHFSGKQMAGKDCGDCHSGGSFGAAIQISRTDIDPLTPLSTHTFTVTVSGSAAKSGFNLAQDVNAETTEGVLSSSDAGVRKEDGELTQTTGRVSGSWTFSWKLPASPGEFTLFAAGAATDGTGGVGGDQTVTTSQAFVVAAAVATSTPTAAGPAKTPTPTPQVTKTPTPAVTATASPAGECGDADGSGTVTVTDGVQTLRAAAGLSSGCVPATCDVDGNGNITVTDGVNVLRTAAGLSAPQNCPVP